MNQHKILTRLFVLTLIVAGLYLWLDRAQAQTSVPYTPSGILVTELGGEVPPGRLNVRFAPRDSAQVGEEIRRLLQSPASLSAKSLSAQVVPSITAEIQTLATGLENDPLAIYDYVHNNVEYIPSWGLLKNPRETLLAGAGNAFDQAALLSALLEAAGYETRYVWGNIRVSKTEAMNWVGATDPIIVGNIFFSGGIPTTNEGSTLLLTHIWVEVFDGGSWHSLDPSFKTYSEQSGQDLRSLMGYDLPTFISDAEDGATITDDYVQNLNYTQTHSNLITYTLNLVNHLRNGDTFIYPEDLIGERRIEPLESVAYSAPLSYTVVVTSGLADDIPSSMAYTLTIQLPGLDYTVNVDDIAGERISIFYECASPEDCQQLEDGGGVYNVEPANEVYMVPRLRIGGEIAATGSVSASLGAWQQLDVNIDTPMGWSAPFSQYLTVGEWYALPMRLQTVSNRSLSRHIKLLNEAMSQGLDPDDERVLGQILYVLGLSYFNEVGLGDRIDSRLAQIVHVPHFSMMIASRNLVVYVDTGQNPVSLDPASHSVDVQVSIDTVISAENPANDDRERAWFLNAGIRGSAVEHAIMEQLQPVPAVSTIQILRLAIEDGQRIYYITPANWSAVNSALGHSTNVLNAVVDALNSGRHVIIPQNPVTFYQWQGAGWISLDPDSGSAGYMIAGSIDPTARRAPIISGGSIAIQARTYFNAFINNIRAMRDLSQEQAKEQLLDKIKEALKQVRNLRPGPAETDPVSLDHDALDPIDTTTGSFLYHHVDLAPLGGLGMPLGFERSYVSSRHSLTSSLGYGWSHTYNTRFYTSTDWVRGLGGQTALEAAPALVASRVGLDLFDETTIPDQRYPMDVLVAQWLMNQITGNAITVGEADGNVSAHVHLMDGAYQPPSGRPILSTVSSATLEWEDGRRAHFDADGLPTAFDDANGNRTTLNYDGQSRLSQVTDAVGRSLTFSYDGQGRLSQVSDPLSRTWSYGYDAHGNLETCTDPQGGVTSYAYDADHRLTSVTDPLNTTYVSNQYNALGQVELQTNGRSGQSSLLYGGDHTIVTDPLDYRTTYSYDQRKRLLSITDALGARRLAAYDAASHEITRTNGLGQVTAFAYDAWGRPTTITDALGYTTTWAYDAGGNPVSYTNQHSQTWQFGYDERHNLLSISNPLEHTTSYTYNSQGQLIGAQNAAGISATYSYDTRGNLESITNALGESAWGYDSVGRLTSFTDGTGHTYQFSYDAQDNLTQVTDPLGHATAYGYDANGNLTSITDANGHTISYTYDAQFNLTAVTDPLGRDTLYEYDANDGLVNLTDANNHTTTYQLDPLGRVITITDPLERSVAFTHDAAGRITAFGRADGSSIDYLQDALGRLTGIDYPTDPDISYSFDAAGNLTRAVYGAWSANYAYDDAGRLITVEDESNNLTTSYKYDSADLRTGQQVHRDTTLLYDVAYGYNAASQMSTLTDLLNAPADTINFGYDTTGRLTQITYPGGVQTDHVFDAAGRKTLVSHQDGQGANVAAYAYMYDADGNTTTVTETTPVGVFSTTYTYDDLDQLTGETYASYAIEYSYDAVGNMTRRADPLGTLDMVYDKADQLQSWGSESFGYDLHGNQTFWQNERGNYIYAYNYENLLTNLTLPGGVTMTFTYDAFGRQLGSQGSVETQSFVSAGLKDNNDLEQATNSCPGGAIFYYYHQGENNNILLANRTEQLADLTIQLGDALGNVRGFMYFVNGRWQLFNSHPHYEAYGQSYQLAGITSPPPGFGGKHNLSRSHIQTLPLGLVGSMRMGHRDYNLRGNFLTLDPVSGSDPNDRRFELSNPLRYRDFTGLRPEHERIDPRKLDNLKSLIQEYGLAFRNSLTTILTSLDQQPEKQRRTSLFMAKIYKSLPKEIRDFIKTDYQQNCEFCRQATVARRATDSPRWLPIAVHGSTYALACTADDHLLAGAFHAGLFRSLDSGHAAWDEEHTAGVGEITVVDASAYYAGTWYGGALKSADGGDSWTYINTGLTANHVYALASDPATPNRLFAATEMGLFVSDDAGASWGRPAPPPPGRSVSDLALSGNALLAVSDFGLYRSLDGGSVWLTPTTDLPTVRINTLLVGSPSSVVYAGTAQGVYQSTDSGDTWALLGTGLGDSDVHALAIDPADADHVVAGTTTGLFVSADGGAVWTADTRAGLDGIASLVGALSFCPDGGDANLYLGVGGGVYALRTPTPPDSVLIIGPEKGVVQTSYTFSATVSPISTTMPITYIWEATDHSTRTNVGVYSLSNLEAFSWDAPGSKVVTVTVDNSVGVTSTVHSITISRQAPTGVSISGPSSGAVDVSYTFTATVRPITTTLPLTYSWEATGQTAILNTNVNHVADSVSFDPWDTPGVQTITVTVSNAAGMISTVHTITISRQAPVGVSISGPPSGAVGVSYTFTATARPVTTTLALTYSWEATGQTAILNTDVNRLTDTVSFGPWDTPGVQTITLTVSNAAGMTSTVHTITIISPQAPVGVSISGPPSGAVGVSYTFTATARPVTTTLPLTYSWEATGQTAVLHTNVNCLTDTVSFDPWGTPGVQTITLSVSNAAGMTGTVHTITIISPQAPVGVSISGPPSGMVGVSYTFTATASPVTTTLPLTYSWEATSQTAVLHTNVNRLTDTVSFDPWDTPGVQTITITVSNGAGMTSATHAITIAFDGYRVYLPLVLRQH